MNWLDSASINLLNKDLDGLWQRQRAISDNIANFETPGYKSKSVSFEDQLKSQLFKENESENELVDGIKNVQPITETAEDETFRLDGNGVDLEKENIEMSRSQLNYMYSLTAINDTFSRLRTVIKG